VSNLRELFQYRALVWALTARELKSRYRGSLLGFFWTFLNPLLLMAVYALVFSVFMQQQIPHYTYFMFVGLLPWIWFSSAMLAGTASLSAKRDLLTRVKFPPQVLPAVVILSELCNYLLAVPLMLALGLLSGVFPGPAVLLFPLVVAVQALFTIAVVLATSALNVFYRDLQHVLTNLITLWFFLVPVVYSADVIPKAFRGPVIFGDPMAVVITSYQAIFYYGRLPDFRGLALATALSLVVLMGALSLFESRRDEFAEFV
jgi:lipopolysaccharide transport system permease protein